MPHQLPDLALTLAIGIVQILGLRMVLDGPTRSASPRIRQLLKFGAGTYLALLILCHVAIWGAENWLPRFLTGWARAIVLIWGVLSLFWIVLYKLTKLLPTAPSPGRRRFLVAARTVLFGAPAIAAGYGVFIQRFRLTLREQKISVPNLPQELEGFKMVQVTDIHLSPFLSEKELAQAIGLANETKAHLALVTGDLISARHDPLDECLRHVAGLRADLGIYGCMGNHERYAETEDYTESQGAKLGVRFLRNSRVKLDFRGASLSLAGVDY